MNNLYLLWLNGTLLQTKHSSTYTWSFCASLCKFSLDYHISASQANLLTNYIKFTDWPGLLKSKNLRKICTKSHIRFLLWPKGPTYYDDVATIENKRHVRVNIAIDTTLVTMFSIIPSYLPSIRPPLFPCHTKHWLGFPLDTLCRRRFPSAHYRVHLCSLYIWALKNYSCIFVSVTKSGKWFFSRRGKIGIN